MRSTSHDHGTDYLATCDKILDWADGQSNFDTGFVCSMRDELLIGRDLTEKQKQALTNIYTKCVARDEE